MVRFACWKEFRGFAGFSPVSIVLMFVFLQLVGVSCTRLSIGSHERYHRAVWRTECQAIQRHNAAIAAYEHGRCDPRLLPGTRSDGGRDARYMNLVLCLEQAQDFGDRRNAYLSLIGEPRLPGWTRLDQLQALEQRDGDIQDRLHILWNGGKGSHVSEATTNHLAGRHARRVLPRLPQHASHGPAYDRTFLSLFFFLNAFLYFFKMRLDRVWEPQDGKRVLVLPGTLGGWLLALLCAPAFAADYVLGGLWLAAPSIWSFLMTDLPLFASRGWSALYALLQRLATMDVRVACKGLRVYFGKGICILSVCWTEWRIRHGSDIRVARRHLRLARLQAFKIPSDRSRQKRLQKIALLEGKIEHLIKQRLKRARYERGVVYIEALDYAEAVVNASREIEEMLDHK